MDGLHQLARFLENQQVFERPRRSQLPSRANFLSGLSLQHFNLQPLNIST